MTEWTYDEAGSSFNNPRLAIEQLTAERDEARDRIARALLTVSHHSKTAAILRGDDQ
jgi:hypothetical protein